VARSIRLVLEANAQRLLQLWAPLLCWVMLARGDIDGIVGYRPEAIDLPAGALIAREAGMELRALDGGPFDDTVDEPGDRRDQSFVAGSSQTVNWLVTLVKEAVRVEPALTRLWHGEQLLRPSTAPPGHNGHEPG
jgi:myo-inositol-1(or 4)-monophosphatase